MAKKKAAKKVRVQLIMPEQLRNRIVKAADDTDMPMSQWLRMAVREYLSK